VAVVAGALDPGTEGVRFDATGRGTGACVAEGAGASVTSGAGAWLGSGAASVTVGGGGAVAGVAAIVG